MKILIADDEFDTVTSLKMILEHKGHDVHAVDNGKKALTFLQKNKYDVAFLDHNMPELTGLEIAQYVQDRNMQVKVILITGDEGISDILAIPLGASAYIRKPFTMEDILKVLHKFS